MRKTLPCGAVLLVLLFSVLPSPVPAQDDRAQIAAANLATALKALEASQQNPYGGAGNIAVVSDDRIRAEAARCAPDSRAFRLWLKTAIAKGNVDLFTELAQAKAAAGPGAQAPYPADNHGKTALMYAAEIGNLEAVHKLIWLDKDTDQWRHKYDATYMNMCETNPDMVTTFGYSALMYASANGRIDVVNYLLNAGADISKQCRFAHYTALQLAQSGDSPNHEKVADALTRKMDEKSVWDNVSSNGVWAGVILGVPALILFWWKVLRTYRAKLDRAQRAKPEQQAVERTLP